MNVLGAIADQIAGGPTWECSHGHELHSVRVVPVALDGRHDRILDYPGVPHHLARRFEMAVWDWQPRWGIGGYCPQNDIVSECIDTQGVWEGYGTNLALALLADGGVFIDCGSQIGWYSALAAASGCEVLSIDADPATQVPLDKTVEINGWSDRVRLCRAGIGPATPVVTAIPERVALMKVDIEGREDDAVRVFRHVLDVTDAVLMEMSPCFAGYYGDLAASLCSRGFDAYLVPEKGTDLDAWAIDPLAALVEHRLDPTTIRSAVNGWHQRDVLFARPGTI